MLSLSPAKVVSERDAQDVVEIMREALYDRFMDDVACIDFRRVSRPGI